MNFNSQPPLLYLHPFFCRYLVELPSYHFGTGWPHTGWSFFLKKSNFQEIRGFVPLKPVKTVPPFPYLQILFVTPLSTLPNTVISPWTLEKRHIIVLQQRFDRKKTSTFSETAILLTYFPLSTVDHPVYIRTLTHILPPNSKLMPRFFHNPVGRLLLCWVSLCMPTSSPSRLV